jgi:uncharacterized protein
LPGKILVKAITELDRHDTVIGPSADGGYYLIGFRPDTFNADILKNISWSTNAVYDLTCRKLAKLGLNTHILPQWRDIDTCEDLIELAASLSSSRTTADKTKNYLEQMKISDSSESLYERCEG